MTDPAIEAAQRAWEKRYANPFDMIAAAREMAKPIRELHAEWYAGGKQLFLHPQAKAILDELAPLIYTTEELKQ